MIPSESYFNTPEYLAYLQAHCGLANTQAQGRVAGSDLALAMIQELGITPGARVLELGCGVGRILHLLRTRFGADVLGCDVSAPAIAHIQASDPVLAGRVHCCPSDAADFVATGSIDHVVTWGVFELTDQKRTLIEIARMLRNGGSALLGSVKSRNYFPDDEDSVAAHHAYIAKSIPICYTDVAQLHKLLAFLQCKVVKRVIFERKQDLTAGRFHMDAGGSSTQFAEAIYVIEKVASTPLDEPIRIVPSESPVSP